MKYWIFQSNQVLGPYEPDDLSRHSAFGAESLVCPEGRRGTSMGDWQRAGMVPDLSVALVRASQSHSVQSSVATLAGLPPEPTLKDLAVLGSLQEKMSMLEDVVLQLQEGLRVKDAELASLHQELAGKERQSSAMKSELEREAADLKAETEERKREAEDLQAQTTEFKKRMAELEERVGVVNRLNDTIEKAVEAEKNVEHDVEAQGTLLGELTKEIETLRIQLNERLTAAAPMPEAPVPAPPEVPVSALPEAPLSVPVPAPAWEAPSEAMEFPSIAPAPAPSASAPLPDVALPPPSEPAAPQASAPGSPLPSFGGEMPSFGEAPAPVSLNPLADAPVEPAPDAPAPLLEPVVDAAAPAPKSRKKALMFGALAGVAALGVIAVVFGGSSKKRKPSVPAGMADTAPLPTPVAAPASVAAAAPAAIPAPVPAPAPDPREAAIEAAKEWELPDGRRLGQALETLSPPIGNLSPWMAEPLTDERVSVNYFAHGGGAGAPTVAYEFEVDLGAKTVAGRNPAAKVVLSGKVAPPPAPPKAKRVTLKPKAAKTAPAAKPKEENLDSLLGTDSAAAPKPEAALADPGEAAAPAKPTTAKRAAKAAAKPAPVKKAADEALLDDILKE